MSVQFNPKLAVATGCALAFLSAGVNACYLVEMGASVSHLTGDVSKVASSLVEKHEGGSIAALRLVVATFAFAAGAAMSGFFIHHPTMTVQRPYGRALLAVGSCLGVAFALFVTHPTLSIALAGVACGFQNALATHYRGLVLRTTHVTGLLTDLGTSIGMALKGHHIAPWKIWVPLLLLLSFFCGALSGCLVYAQLKQQTLLILSSLYLLLGLTWIFYRWFFMGKKQPEEDPSIPLEKH